MVSLLIAMLLMAGSSSLPSGNRNQVAAPSAVTAGNVDDAPPPAPPETDISISDVE